MDVRSVFIRSLILTVMCSGVLAGATPQDHRKEQAAAILSDALSSGSFAVPGAAVSVVLHGEFVYEGAAGVADLATGRVTTPKTRFRLYSTA